MQGMGEGDVPEDLDRLSDLGFLRFVTVELFDFLEESFNEWMLGVDLERLYPNLHQRYT